MKLQTTHYLKDRGWTLEPTPELDSPHTLILVFGAASYFDKPDPLNDYLRHYPLSQVLGCSTSGEITGGSIYDESLSVAVIQFERTTLKSIALPLQEPQKSYAVGQQLAHNLDSPQLNGVFILSEGLHVNGSEVIRGINSTLRREVIVTGGLAGDGAHFKRTWTLVNRKPLADHVTAVGFYGSHVQIGHGSRGGWDVFGPERRITRSSANILYELDGKPALSLYKEYLGERAQELPASGLLFPLAIRSSESETKTLVRTILAVDEAQQSLTFAGDIPQGALAQLMRANFDRLIDAAGEAGEMARYQTANMPILAISISCVGRRLIMGQRTEEEVEAALESFPPGTKQIGYYSYGELSPFATGHCDLHNQTMTITTLSEG